MLNNSCFIFCSILEVSNAPAISDCGAKNADFPNIFEELEEEIELITGVSIYTSSITLQGAVEKDEELSLVLEYDLSGEKYSPG